VYRWICVVALGILLAAISAGCGGSGGGGGEGETSPPLTKAQFIKKADAICAKRKKEWDSASAAFQKEAAGKKEMSRVKGLELFAGVLEETLVPSLQRELASLEELGAPKGDEATIERMLKRRGESIEKIEDEGFQALYTTETLGTFVKEAEAYGMNCPY
jgi:hypothetical protein